MENVINTTLFYQCKAHARDLARCMLEGNPQRTVILDAEAHFFEKTACPYLFGTEEIRGKKRILGDSNHGKIQDKNIRGPVENVYRILHSNGELPENCDEPLYPDCETRPYRLEGDAEGKKYSCQELNRWFFCLDGKDTTVCVQDIGGFKVGQLCSVVPEAETLLIKKEV